MSNGEYVVVEQVQHEILEEPVKVYNFEVEDYHTYHVGVNYVLVHNACGADGNLSSYYTYKELKAEIKNSGLSGRGTGFEAHHLLEKQFASKFGVKSDEIISVALTPRWHRGVSGQKIIGEGINIDNRISNELVNITGAKNKKSATAMASTEQIWQAHRNVYESIGQYDWANAVYSAYVKPLGINY